MQSQIFRETNAGYPEISSLCTKPAQARPSLMAVLGRVVSGQAQLPSGVALSAKAYADLAIDEDPFAPCLWVPSEWWPQFLAETDRKPNAIGAVIYRNKTVRDGGPGTDFQTGSDQGGYRRR